MAGRRYATELLLAIGLYAILLIGSLLFLNAQPGSALRIPIALLPMLPALAIPVVVARGLARMDELQRRIQLEALGFAFAATAVLTFGWGFLENVGFPRMGGFVVWPMMALLWALGAFVANRRFR